jgi:hypothetical protein
MKQALFTALAVTLAATGIVSARAQQTDRVLVLYGNDKCPTNANGEQIVVCTRRPEGERYRIPKELRSPIIITPENQSWAAKANDTLNAGAATGAGSCSAVGAGGWTGCWAQQMRDAKRQRQAQAAESTAVDTQVSRPR